MSLFLLFLAIVQRGFDFLFFLLFCYSYHKVNESNNKRISIVLHLPPYLSIYLYLVTI
jgi:hypothetical protein